MDSYIKLNLFGRACLSRTYDNVKGAIKIGNIAPRVGIEPTYITVRDRVLTISFPDVTTLPTYTSICGPLCDSSMQTTGLTFYISHQFSYMFMVAYISLGTIRCVGLIVLARMQIIGIAIRGRLIGWTRLLYRDLDIFC